MYLGNMHGPDKCRLGLVSVFRIKTFGLICAKSLLYWPGSVAEGCPGLLELVVVELGSRVSEHL